MWESRYSIHPTDEGARELIGDRGPVLELMVGEGGEGYRIIGSESKPDSALRPSADYYGD